MNLSRSLFVLLFLAVISTKTQASSSASQEYDLPALLGVHSHVDRTFKLPIDLKSTFASIAKVELYIEGTASPGSAVPLEGLKEEFQLPVEFHLSFTDRSQPVGLQTPIAMFGPLVGYFGTQSLFKPLSKKYASDWSFLKKGTGELHFSWGKDCPGACRYINHSTVEITKVVLVVTGELQTASDGTIEKSSEVILTGQPHVIAGADIPKQQKFLFEISTENYAWGRTIRGLYVDNEGGVYEYDHSYEVWRPSGRDGYNVEDLLRKFEKKKSKTTIDALTLKRMFNLIEPASAGQLTAPAHICNDYGIISYIAYRYDIQSGFYKPVLLYQVGDTAQKNQSDSAKTLYEWLFSISGITPKSCLP